MDLIVRLKVAIRFIFIKHRNLNWEHVMANVEWIGIAIALDNSGGVVWFGEHVITNVW